MVKNLSHDDWVREQFKPQYLKSLYRNALLHASMIEGILTNESGTGTSDSANKLLLCVGKTTAFEFCLFNEIRQTRNRLVHAIFKKQKPLPQNQIGGLIGELMKKILEAYRTSSFLDRTLFSKYRIVRVPAIVFTPASR